MALRGRGKKKNRDVSEVLKDVQKAKSKGELKNIGKWMEGEAENYSPEDVKRVFREVAKRLQEMGDLKSSYSYFLKAGERKRAMELLKDLGSCERIKELMEKWKTHKFSPELMECYYNRKDYVSILNEYREHFSQSKRNKVLYFALLSSIKLGEIDKVHNIASLIQEGDGKGKYSLNLALGRYEEFRGNYKEALKYYQKAKEVKDTEEVKFRMGWVMYLLKDMDGLNHLIEELPEDSSIKPLLNALTLIMEGRGEEAITTLPEMGDAYAVESYLIRAIVLQEKSPVEAKNYVEDALSIEPYNLVALDLYSKLVDNEGKAREIYEKMLKINDNICEPYLGLAKLSVGDERKNYAAKALERDRGCDEAKVILAEFEVESSPDDVISMLRGVETPRANYLMALALHKRGEDGEAENYVRRAMMREERSEYKLLLAEIKFKRNKEEAKKLLEEVLAEEPNNGKAKFLLAEIIHQDEPERALELIKDGEDYKSRWLKVKIYKILGREEDAKEELDAILEMDVGVEDYISLAKMSETEEAIEILTTVLNKDPENLQARIMLAELLLDSDPERATSLLKDVEDSRANRIVGLAYMKLGRYEDAYSSFKLCAEVDFQCKSNMVKAGMKVGKFRDILPVAKEIATSEPTMENLLLLAKIYESISPESAYEAYREVALKYPDKVELWQKVTEYAEKSKRWDDAIEAYDRLYEITGDLKFLIKKSVILENTGRYEELYNTYTQILSSNPEMEEIEDKRDSLLIKMGRYRDLIQLAEYWISKKKGKAAKGYYLRALAYKNLGEYLEAINNIEKAIELSRENKYLELKAEILHLMGNLEEAERTISQVKKPTQNALLLRAKILLSLGRRGEAENILKDLEKAGVKEAYVELSKIYAEDGRKDEAMKYLQLSAEAMESIDIYKFAAKTAYQFGEYLKALEFINGGLRKDSTDEDLWVLKILSLLKIGKKEDAHRAVRRLLTVKDTEEYRLVQAHVLNQLGRYREAYQILTSLPEIRYYDVYSKEEMAWSLYKMGDYEGSISIYRRLGNEEMIARNLFAMGRYREILRMEGDSPTLLEIKGDACLKLGKKEEAERYYQESVKKGNMEAKRKLADLLRDLGELNRAYLLYEEIGDADSIAKAAEILDSLGQYGDAEKLYEETFRRTGNVVMGLRAVRILVKMKMLDRAAQLLEEMENTDEVIKEKAKVYYKLGRYSEAIGILRLLEEEDFETNALLGDVYYALGQARRAKEYYEKALKYKEDKNVMKSLARCYEILRDLSSAANLYMRCGDEESFKRAERILKELNDVDKLKTLYEARLQEELDIQTMKNLADIYASMGEYNRAYSLYQEVKDYEFSPEVLTRIGTVEIELGKYEEAEENLKLSLEMEPLSDTYYYLGKLYTALGRYSEAKEMYSKSDHQYRDKELCKVALLSGDIQGALNLAEKITDEINDGESWYLYGEALARIGDYENSLKAIRIAEEKGFNDHRELLAKIYLKLGQYERAIRVSETIENKEFAGIVSAIAHAKLGEFDKGIEALNGIENGDSTRYLGDLHFMRLLNITQVYVPNSEYRKRELERIREFYRKSMKMKHEYSDEKYLYNNLGVLCFLLGERAKGTEYLEISGKDEINLLSAYALLGEWENIERIKGGEYSKVGAYWNSMGVYYSKMERFDEAIEYFNNGGGVSKGIERDVITYNRALLLLKLGMYESALEILSTVKIPDALILRTYGYLKLGEFEKARQNMKKYEVERDIPEIHYLRAYLDMKLGSYESALKHINKALVEAKENPDFWMLKGIVLTRMGKLDDALRAFEVANHIKNSPEAKVGMSAVMVLKGDLEGAKSIISNPEHPLEKLNYGCALAREGKFEEAERYFVEVHKEMDNERALYYAYLSALERGEPPEIKEKYAIETGEFDLAHMLVSNYRIQITIVPSVVDGRMRYDMRIKNISGDPISPFTVSPIVGSEESVERMVGPIRPYEEVELSFEGVPEANMTGLLPGKHLEIRYVLKQKGVGIVEEVLVKNLTKYELKDVRVKPVSIGVFKPWKEEMVIEKLGPGEERTVKFGLIHEDKIKLLSTWEEKYGHFEPEFVEPLIDPSNFEYKVIFSLHPFEFILPEVEVEYDTERVGKLIKKERRRMLVKSVSKYTEALVSVEK